MIAGEPVCGATIGLLLPSYRPGDRSPTLCSGSRTAMERAVCQGGACSHCKHSRKLYRGQACWNGMSSRLLAVLAAVPAGGLTGLHAPYFQAHSISKGCQLSSPGAGGSRWDRSRHPAPAGPCSQSGAAGEAEGGREQGWISCCRARKAGGACRESKGMQTSKGGHALQEASQLNLL